MSSNKCKSLELMALALGFEPVLWSDDMKTELFGHVHQWWVWRRQKDAYAEKYLILNVKYGGGSLMLWSNFASTGPGPF